MNATITLPKPIHQTTNVRNPSNDSTPKEPMSTFDITTPDRTISATDELDTLIAEPPAPDERRPPGRGPDRSLDPRRNGADREGASRFGTDAAIDIDGDLDESLEARAPVARCADGNGTMNGLFFSDHVVDIARAKAMCALCPIAIGCLDGALEREEPWGVWGGELLSGGRIVANKRPCGRPPKQPRPEVVYDEMGPVGIPA